MAVESFTHSVFLGDGSGSLGTGGSISWSFAFDFDVASDVNSGSDGLLDENVDTFGPFGRYPYTGYTVDFEGRTYAIFGRFAEIDEDQDLLIPYNKAVHDILPLAEPGGATMTYAPTGAQVFNCFATGTTIATPDGERAIEAFQPGDRVLTRDGRSVPVVWVARQAVSNPRAVELGRRPVRIEAGALGPGLPAAPLTVTGDHALLFDDLLINAGALVNGTSIRLVPLAEMPTKFTWWHLELEEHEAIVANGVAAESFIDYNGRSGFDNYGEYLDLAGSDRHIVEMPLARISSQRLLPAELCELLGIAMTSTGPVADGGPGKPNAAVSARFGPARRRLPRALGRFSGAVRLVSGAIRRVATRKAA